MRVDMLSDGTLFLSADSPVESFALLAWSQQGEKKIQYSFHDKNLLDLSKEFEEMIEQIGKEKKEFYAWKALRELEAKESGQ